jgi:hypothetical protein
MPAAYADRDGPPAQPEIDMRTRRDRVASPGAAIMKRIINGFEVDWASERVFAEQQTAPNYGYLFEVSADRKRIVRCAHISAIGGDSDNPDGDAERFEKDARQAAEEFLDFEREGK